VIKLDSLHKLKLEFVLVLKTAYIIKKNRSTEQGFSKVHKKNFCWKKLYYDIHSFIGMQRTVYDRAM